MIHIPKTAGTSFRMELERVIPSKQILFDYGDSSSKTSRCVSTSLYQNGSFSDLEQEIAERRSDHSVVLAGHFPKSKYERLFAPECTISFVREPLLRCASEFLHFGRSKGYEATFDEFVERPDIVNRQMRYLMPYDERMFIGITEDYAYSLQVFCERFNLNLRSTTKNVSPQGGAEKFVSKLSRQQVDRFYELNREDVHFYENATSRLKER